MSSKMTEVMERPSHARMSKTVLVYINGNAYFPGKRFVINSRQLLTFDSFLNAVTHGITASFGAVRKVYTPREGHRVMSLDTLEHGKKYVVGGTERFKKMDYNKIVVRKPQRKTSDMVQPVAHSTINVPTRRRRIMYEPCTINVFTNGDILVPAVRIFLPKYTLMSWERVLAMVTEKVHLCTGAVHKLYRLDGTPITSSRQLEHNHYYVGVGTERFRLLPYLHWVPMKNIVQKGSLCDFLPSAPRKGKIKQDLFADPKLYGNSLFYAKQNKRSEESLKTQPLLSSGEGSVFRAKHSRIETSGAVEVPEDKHVKLVLPIDQMEAIVVEEEQCEMLEHRTCRSKSTPPRSKDVNEAVEEKCDMTDAEISDISEEPSEMSEVFEEPSRLCGRITRILPPNEHLALPCIDPPSVASTSSSLTD